MDSPEISILQNVKQELPDMSDDDLLPSDLVIDSDEIPVDAANIAESKRKLMDTLSFSYPGGSLANALSQLKQDTDPLSQSCFSQIRLDKGRDEFEDDELTNLDWLQDKNLLKSISGNTRLCPSPLSSDGNVSDFNSESGKENDSVTGSYNMSPMPHPTHIPYNPHKHVQSKPPYSFSCLIFMAIEDSEEKKLPVKDIYSWILTHFPYFQHAPTGWKNSVRHNLSLNKCFQKVDKDKSSNVGKGSYWCIDSDFRPNLLQALRKTPYHPYHQLQMLSSPLSSYTTPNKSPFNSPFSSANTLSPHLFPLLSKRLNSASRSTLESDIDVANALVSLKKSGRSSRRRRPRPLKGFSSRSRSPSPPEFGSTADKERTTRRSRRNMSPIIVTRVPSCDHTYSASSIPKALLNLEADSDSSIDGEYEFNELISGDEFDSAEEEHMEVDFRFSSKREARGAQTAAPFVEVNLAPLVDKEKEIEGVNALLDLASMATGIGSNIGPKPNDSPARNTRSARKS